MTNIVIPVSNKEESKFLLNLAKKLGYNPFAIDDNNMLSRLKFAALTDEMRKKPASKFSMDEIRKETDAVRRKRYDKQRKNKVSR